MKKIGITVYAFNVQNNVNQRMELHNIANRLGFIEILQDFMYRHNFDYTREDVMEKVFKTNDYTVEKINDDAGNEKFTIVSGMIKTGDYGIESEIVDSGTGQTVYTKSAADADVMPFFFSVAVPSGQTDRGIIIFQTLGIYGMKTVFHKKLEDFIKEIDPALKLIIGNVMPRAYIEHYLDYGVLQKIRLLKYDIPNDVSERIGINNGVQTSYQELIIHKPVGFLERKRQLVNECLRGQRFCNSIIEIDNFEYDNLKLEIQLGKGTKTFNLANIDNLVVTEDITERVTILGGNPTDNSIKPILTETSEQYLGEMGLA